MRGLTKMSDFWRTSQAKPSFLRFSCFFFFLGETFCHHFFGCLAGLGGGSAGVAALGGTWLAFEWLAEVSLGWLG